jgi:CMP-N,N'-diacetyllegionaminic acid synthase
MVNLSHLFDYYSKRHYEFQQAWGIVGQAFTLISFETFAMVFCDKFSITGYPAMVLYIGFPIFAVLGITYMGYKMIQSGYASAFQQNAANVNPQWVELVTNTTANTRCIIEMKELLMGLHKKKTRIIAVITARGGSKRLPGKNIKLLAGKPLIAWTIDTALKSKEVDRVIVSTEDINIAEIAKSYGAEVPFLRPSELAEDNTLSIDVIIHVIKELGLNEDDYILLLQPTSPLRGIEDIKKCIDQIQYNILDAVVSTTEGTEKPNGAIYLNKVSSLVTTRTFYPEGKTTWYAMPIERSIDIDTVEQFEQAESLLKKKV